MCKLIHLAQIENAVSQRHTKCGCPHTGHPVQGKATCADYSIWQNEQSAAGSTSPEVSLRSEMAVTVAVMTRLPQRAHNLVQYLLD